jgi:hypothetical protein
MRLDMSTMTMNVTYDMVCEKNLMYGKHMNLPGCVDKSEMNKQRL